MRLPLLLAANFFIANAIACNPGASSSGAGTSQTDAGEGSEAFCGADTLAPRCTADWYSDGECDPSNNFEACNWDGGDCCESTCSGGDCGESGFECRDPAAGGKGIPGPVALGSPCAVIDDPFAPAHIGSEVALLSDDALLGRRPSTQGDMTTRAYVEERFRCLGLAPMEDDCYQQGVYSDDGDPTANVLARLEGSDLSDEIIVIGAHHDHLGIESFEIKNGANDNASGLIALMSIADMFSRGPTPRRTIVFAAFGAEEIGLDGSRHFAVNPPPGVDMDKVVYMVNLDMLGTYDINGSVEGFGTFTGTPGRIILEDALQNYSDITVNLGIPSPDDDSDFDPFCESGIPYVYFETYDDPCWHESCDDAARMDFDNMSKLVSILYDVSAGLANTDTDLVAARQEFGCSKVASRKSPGAATTSTPPEKQRRRHLQAHSQSPRKHAH